MSTRLCIRTRAAGWVPGAVCVPSRKWYHDLLLLSLVSSPAMQGKQMGSRVKGGASWPRGAAWGAGRGCGGGWEGLRGGLGRHSRSGRAWGSPAGPSRGPRSICEDRSVKTEHEDRAGSGQKAALYCRELASPSTSPHSSPRKKVHGGGQDSQQVPRAPSAVPSASTACFPTVLVAPATVPLQRDFP